MIIELGHLPDPDLNPNKRLHYMKLASVKRAAKDQAMALVYEQGRPETPYESAHITITWVAGDKRRRDPDNLFASMKPYIDGLVDAGLIADDSAMHVSYTLRYERGDKNNTIIKIEEIGYGSKSRRTGSRDVAQERMAGVNQGMARSSSL